MAKTVADRTKNLNRSLYESTQRTCSQRLTSLQARMCRFIKRCTPSYGFLGAIELSKIKTKTQPSAIFSAQRAGTRRRFCSRQATREGSGLASRSCCV